MMLGFLLVVLVLICVALTVVILLQQAEGGAFGMGGGNPSGILTARGAGDLLTRTTSVLAGLFFALCLLLTILSARSHGNGESVVDRLKVDAMNPDALNNAMRATTGAAPSAAAAGAAATSSTTTTAPAGGPAAPAPPSFQAPAPQVHVAPAGSPASRPSATAATPTDSGANARASHLLGVQSAPQSEPTVAPHATTAPSPAVTAPAPVAPPSAATAPPPAEPATTGGNTTH